MKRIICAIRGHALIRVTEVGLAARPGGMLPALDGYVAYEPDAEGEHQACTRCGAVLDGDNDDH